MLAGKAFQAELAEVVEGPSLPAADPAWLANVVKAEEPPTWWGMQPQGQQPRGKLFPQEMVTGYEPEDFGSPEEYRAYLEEVREEVDERLREAEAALEEKGR
ncbi:MAG: hypothetical protein NTW87_06160 [Planctomycetota bacterium]|nr:hypothetical protein [Planctomycetota bacterium]